MLTNTMYTVIEVWWGESCMCQTCSSDLIVFWCNVVMYYVVAIGNSPRYNNIVT